MSYVDRLGKVTASYWTTMAATIAEQLRHMLEGQLSQELVLGQFEAADRFFTRVGVGIAQHRGQDCDRTIPSAAGMSNFTIALNVFLRIIPNLSRAGIHDLLRIIDGKITLYAASLRVLQSGAPVEILDRELLHELQLFMHELYEQGTIARQHEWYARSHDNDELFSLSPL